MSKIETLQKTVVTTSFTLQISERDKLNELQHNLYMKSNWYLYVISASLYMVLLLALDLVVIPKTQSLSTDCVLGKTQMKADHLQEKEYEQSSERDKLTVKDF